MPTYEWRELFSVGQEDIDRQHKQLFDIANGICERLHHQSDVSAAELETMLAGLCSYTRQHFAEEEGLLLAAEYPDFERHKESHQLLLGRIEVFAARCRGGEAGLETEQLLPVLVGEWLAHHIAFEDQQYAPYLNRHMRRQRAWRLPVATRSSHRLPD